MSEPALSISFSDSEHGLHGSARAGASVLFEGTASTVLPEGPAVERHGSGWRAELDGAFSLELVPVAEGVALGGVTAHACRVRGTVGAQEVRCFGSVAETTRAPEWEELDALRSIAAVFDGGHGFLALGQRPRGARGQDEERVVGWLLEDGLPLGVEDTRISTVYDGEGHQRSAGLELWLPGEELPRRGSGTVVAGTSLQLEGLQVNLAIFDWQMGEHHGAGAYELWVRREDEAA